MSNKTSTTKGKTKPAKETKGKTLAAEKQPTALVEIVPGKFNENDWYESSTHDHVLIYLI